ncbi:Uncharacterized protein Adt_13450 [Abeliophyllum distichum]|uniref:Uncharacterized protein n=1 Tax=Abeliophyllum distichum TaxID=126358 RepID=A0ABD1TXE1_9LAMI
MVALSISFFLSTYEQMNIGTPLESSIEPHYDFTGDCVIPKGIVHLVVTMGEEPLAVHTFMEFLVVDRSIATVRSNQPKAMKCYRNALRKTEKKEINMTFLDVEMTEASEEASEDITMKEAASSEDINPRIHELTLRIHQLRS